VDETASLLRYSLAGRFFTYFIDLLSVFLF